jgi:hypothetical protein
MLMISAVPAFAAKTSDKKPLTVTLDVKDEDVHDILKSLQKQCAIKNLAIDPGVPHTKGTFYLRDVSCDKAFDVVLRTFDLRAVAHDQALTAIERRP